MKKELIKVTSGYERFVHWLLAISCLLLCYTGLGMMYESLNILGVIFGGLKGLKTVHDIMAVVFAIGLVLAIQMWWREAGIFVFPEDWEWIKAAGIYGTWIKFLRPANTIRGRRCFSLQSPYLGY